MMMMNYWANTITQHLARGCNCSSADTVKTELTITTDDFLMSSFH